MESLPLLNANTVIVQRLMLWRPTLYEKP